MKLYWEIIKLLFKKYILRKNTGQVVKEFVLSMGIVYIKLAQMLATQNFGNLFTEEDRIMLSSICDDCNPIEYTEIENILRKEYNENIENIFFSIDSKPIGSASVSQVHKGVLRNGDVVAIKVKRKDITNTIEKDIVRIKTLVHRFGKLINFKNILGGDHALELYLKWIKQETDFEQEKKNIELYTDFANNVNGKVSGTKQIKVPKLYKEYCTNNVIVMEFIDLKTINKMELTDEVKKKIVIALNSYIRSSFWAMFNDKQIVFHGDPHSGNVCIDDKGNIYFLDMGLLCVLSEEDAILCRKFFLTAYSGNYKKLYNMLVIYGSMDENQKVLFKNDCKKYCEDVKTKEVTFYFIDMINICLYYDFVPPDFLFSMAKAFICLNGIGKFSGNGVTAKQLLQEQTVEFMMQRSINDIKDIALNGLYTIPNFFENVVEYGLSNTVAKLVSSDLKDDLEKSLDHLKEILDVIKL